MRRPRPKGQSGAERRLKKEAEPERPQPPAPSTLALQERFLAAYRMAGTVALAAAAVPCNRNNHYRWLKTDPTYTERFHDAGEEAVDRLVAEARRRAVEGTQEPVTYRGKPVIVDGKPLYRYRKSDSLLMFLIKAARPEYRDNYRPSQGGAGRWDNDGDVGLGEQELDRMSDDET